VRASPTGPMTCADTPSKAPSHIASDPEDLQGVLYAASVIACLIRVLKHRESLPRPTDRERCR
jgi:hypothetical protein